MKEISGLAISAIAAGLSISAGAAQALEGPSMRLGAPIAAPSGFIALCETNPGECGGRDTSPESLAEIRHWASRERWTAAFNAAGLTTPAAVPPAQIAAPTVVPQAKPKIDARLVRRAKDAARKAASRDHRPGAAKARPQPEARAPSRTPSPQRLPLTTIQSAPAPDRSADHGYGPALSMRTIQQVNTSMNRAIRRSSDQDTFGQADVWNRPIGAGARGDCEDYVLAKRSALIEAGANPALLSIAIVRTRRDEVHAVLLIDIDGDEFVLDNLSPWIVRWDEAPYVWLERQAPGAPLTWVRAA